MATHCRREAAAALRGIHARLWLLFPGGGGDAQHGAAYVRLLRSLPGWGEKVSAFLISPGLTCMLFTHQQRCMALLALPSLRSIAHSWSTGPAGAFG